MPSRADLRIRLEHVLRGIVIAVLAVMLWQSLFQQTVVGGQSVKARGVSGGALARWGALGSAPSSIHAQLDSVPSPVERAWLGALAGAGSAVTWSGDLSPTMIDARPVASPTGGTKVLVAAPNGSSVTLSDELGAIGTVTAKTAGATFTLRSVAGSVTARVKGSGASTVQRDSVVLHRILVIGAAGWESKFVVAALEEEGWKVDAFIRVAPGVDVTQGPTAVIDTSRYSAVVALDGSASPYANRIITFVRTGGGVVLEPQAASLEAMAPLRSGPFISLRSDSVPLARRAGSVPIAARRIGAASPFPLPASPYPLPATPAGRALQIGYEDTWRWRMGGGDGAVRDHREWWTGLVSRVAHAPLVTRAADSISTDEAPMIGLVAAIGAVTPAETIARLSGTPSDWATWLLLVLALALTGEVASRRMRGAS